MKRLRIGIVGCGAIGSSLAKAVRKDFSKVAAVAALCDTDGQKAKLLAKSVFRDTALVVGLEQLISRSDLVIEAASAKASWNIARQALNKGKNILIMSVGGIVGRYTQLTRLAYLHNAKVYIPSGAICGIDALKAAKSGKVRSVSLTTRKHPKSFLNVAYVQKKGIKLDKIIKDTVLFSGPAQEAVKFFPQNINVAAVLSLAGIGPGKTKVTIIADPTAKRNIHEIKIVSDAGEIITRTENVLHPENPKTSFLAVLSALATLRQIVQPVRIGT